MSWLAQTPEVGSLRFRRNFHFLSARVKSILCHSMPRYHRFYSPGTLQFITASTYRRTPIFRSERFRQCFVQRLDEVRQQLHFLLIGWVLMAEHFHLLIKPEPAGWSVPRRTGRGQVGGSITGRMHRFLEWTGWGERKL